MTIYDYRLAKIPFANAAPSNEIQPFPDYNLGLGIAFVQTDGKPEMKGLNGLFQAITVSMLYLRQRGISEWIADFEYPIGSYVSYGNILYKAKAQNINKPPSTSQDDWFIWASINDLKVDANNNISRSLGSDGSVTLKVEDASQSKKGVVQFATPSQVVNKSSENVAIKPSDVPSMFSRTGSRITMPDGSTIIYGNGVWSSGQQTQVSFTSPFPNAALAMTISDSSGGQIAGYQNLTRSGFMLRTPTNLLYYSYIAIGY